MSMPLSKDRGPWGSICALASLALVLACGKPTGAGFHPGTVLGPDGGVVTGAGGNGATGAGGTSTASGTGGALTDGGPLTDALPPFDGGGCTDPGTEQPIGAAAGGSFTGEISGAVCAGGAYAYLESTPAADGGAPTVALYLDSTVSGSPAAAVRFTAPADAVAGEIHVDIGVPAATAGSYALDATCGSAVLIATLPTPDASVCATDGGDGYDCPPGCEQTGPLSDLTCTPIAPQLTFAALAADDCVGDSTAPEGEWTLALTSVTPYPADAGAGYSTYYAVHGTLTATLADQSADAGTAGVSLSLTF
jgi:hypothetical protein